MTGRTLAHYEIADKLGEGGMGTVYKARDLHLDRFVGIKFLRADKHRDAERKRRFILEAKAASALNHPNIITIHDIGTSDDTDYIVMEYVKGQTLAALIGRKGMALGDVLKYGIQIASALATAHSAGIVHRDLKPANVMIAAADGRVKVLDFGLAKLTETVVPDPGEPTQTIRADDTEEGQILGTTAYMAPEQIEGKKVDARTDIFAFGLMLYEMVTGKRAFERDSRMGTLTAILKEQQTPAGEIVTGVPTELDKIISRCLRKEPDRRYQTMRDVGNALEELKEDSESGRLSTASLPTSAPLRTYRMLGGLLVVAAAGTGAWWAANSHRSVPSEHLINLRPITQDAGLNVDPVISPDGRLVAYASDRANQKDLDIWVQPLAKGSQAIRVTKHEAEESQPAFSPDGGLIVFRSSRDGGGLYIVPTFGGEERQIATGGFDPSFSPDGQLIVYSSGDSALSESKIYVVPAAGGPATEVGADVPWRMNGVFSEDSKRLLFYGGAVNYNDADVQWWLAPVQGGKSVRTQIAKRMRRSRLTRRRVTWVGGYLYWDSDGIMYRLRVSADGSVSSEAERLTAATATQEHPAIQAAGPNRLAVFATGADTDHLWSLAVDLEKGVTRGPLELLPHSGGRQMMPAGALAANRLVYTNVDPSGDVIRWRDLETGKERLVANGGRPKISPDGSRIAYSVFTGSPGILLASATGGDPSRLVDFKPGVLTDIYGWTADGQKIVYYEDTPQHFFTVDINTRQRTELIHHPTRGVHGVELSADSQWVAFHIPVGQRSPLYVAPVRDGHAAPDNEWVQVAENGRRPWWSPKQDLLYFQSWMDGYGCVYVQRLDPATKRPLGQASPIQHLHRSRLYSRSGLAFGPAVFRDRLIMSLREQSRDIWIGEMKD